MVSNNSFSPFGNKPSAAPKSSTTPTPAPPPAPAPKDQLININKDYMGKHFGDSTEKNFKVTAGDGNDRINVNQTKTDPNGYKFTQIDGGKGDDTVNLYGKKSDWYIDGNTDSSHVNIHNGTTGEDFELDNIEHVDFQDGETIDTSTIPSTRNTEPSLSSVLSSLGNAMGGMGGTIADQPRTP